MAKETKDHKIMQRRNDAIYSCWCRGLKVKQIADKLKTTTNVVYKVLYGMDIEVKPNSNRKKKKYVSTLPPSHLEWLKMAIREEIPIVKICKQLGHSYGKIIKEINLLHEIDYTKKQKWEKNGYFDVDEFGKLYRP